MHENQAVQAAMGPQTTKVDVSAVILGTDEVITTTYDIKHMGAMAEADAQVNALQIFKNFGGLMKKLDDGSMEFYIASKLGPITFTVHRISVLA